MTIISSLTPETVAAASDEFAGVKSTADAKAYSFALMGGLEYEASRDTNANHADFSGVVGQLHAVDMSGASLTSEVVFTLPATAAVGERTGLYITAGSTTDGEEISVRTPASDTINGTDYSAADWSRLFITGELVIFRCVVANTDWIVEYDGRIASKCKMALTTASTGGGATTWSEPHDSSGVWTSRYDVGSLLDTSNSLAVVRRAGKYFATILGRPNASIDDGDYWGVRFAAADGTTAIFGIQLRQTAPGGGSSLIAAASSQLLDLADGDTLIYQFRGQDANTGVRVVDTTESGDHSAFTIQEVF